MDQDKYLTNKVVSIALVLLSGLSIFVGIADLRSFFIPALWSILEGIVGLFLSWVIWMYRRGGDKMALIFFVADLVGWILISVIFFDSIASMSGIDADQMQLFGQALTRRIQVRIPMAAFLAFWSWIRRDKFIR